MGIKSFHLSVNNRNPAVVITGTLTYGKIGPVNKVEAVCPETLLSDTNALISLPQVCLKLRERLADPQHTRKEVADTILYDPALTARLLRIVNSAYYGLPQPVREISHALNILGEEELHNLVIVTSIVKTMAKVDSPVDINSFWRSSVYAAVMANNLAKNSITEADSWEEFFIAGLLLNIGRLLLYHHEPDLLAEVERQMAETGEADFAVERDLLGFDHSDVGALMARRWNFSDDLIDCIQCHHRPTANIQGVSQSIMALTAYFTDQLDFRNPRQVDLGELKQSKDSLLQNLGLDWQEFCVIANNSYEDYLHAYEAFCGS
jgi:HD-like signal output (HDOD) protein